MFAMKLNGYSSKALANDSLANWAQDEHRQVDESADDQDHAEQERPEGGPSCVQGRADVRVHTRAASEPAIARASTIGPKRPIDIARPSIMSYHGVFAARPANAEPLLLATDAKAYVISDSP